MRIVRKILNTNVTGKQLLPKFASIIEHCSSRQDTEFPIQESKAQSHWVTQSLIIPRSIK